MNKEDVGKLIFEKNINFKKIIKFKKNDKFWEFHILRINFYFQFSEFKDLRIWNSIISKTI